MVKPFSTAIILKIVIFVISAGNVASTDPIVRTEYGQIRGALRYAVGAERPVYSYFGVKYGRSPDYVFRFQPPENPWDWDGIRNATDESRPMCVQDINRYQSLRFHTILKHMMPDNPNMLEDCLLLDIFTPVSPEGGANASLPVILWIHGGSFNAFVSTTKLWGLSAFEDVVLVQVQYRLGVFGFFTTHDEWAPANIALHDQIKAMQWIKRNIRYFGGDPESVTLMGESAGSIAATTHMLIPSSAGLFHRVIGLSGAPDTQKWQETYKDSARRLGKTADCHFESTGAMDMCLQNRIGTSTLMRFAKESDAHFSLSEDSELFPDKVSNLIENSIFASKVPVMMSVVGGEADYLLSRKIFPDIYKKGPTASTQDLRQAMEKHMRDLSTLATSEDVYEIIVQEYMSHSSSDDRFKGFLEAAADCWFVSKAAKFAQKLEDINSRAYLMRFNVKPSMYDKMPDEYPRPYNFTTADHTDDLLYVFGLPFVGEYTDGNSPPMSFTATEKETSRKLMHTIAHFAKTGFPPEELKWPRYPSYLNVGESWKIQNDILSERKMKLWNDVVMRNQ